MLGYFSIIGLLRVHVLLGDFTLALKVMESVELNQKACPGLRKSSAFTHVSQVTFHPCNSMPCYNLLLCWLLLHHATTIPRCHSYFRYHPELHHADASISYKKLSIRSSELFFWSYRILQLMTFRVDQQNGGQNVCSICNMQCALANSIGRQHRERCEGEVQRAV